LGVLGARCRTYEVDMYGARSDTLNAGLATDRLLAEWLTAGEPAPHTRAWPDTLAVVETAPICGARFPYVRRDGSIRSGPRHVAIEVPGNIAALKTTGPTAAAEWQAALREAFQDAFANGFVAVGFDRADVERPRYLLERA